MGRGFNIPLVGASKYYWKLGQNTVDSGFNIPWVGVKISG